MGSVAVAGPPPALNEALLHGDGMQPSQQVNQAHSAPAVPELPNDLTGIGELPAVATHAVAQSLQKGRPSKPAEATAPQGQASITDSLSGRNLRDQQPVDTRVGIDLIGIGCRFPGTGNSMPDRECRSPDDFWRMLLDGSKAAIREIPASRGWDPTEYLDKNGGPGKVITARAGWLDEIDRFDHALFHLSRKEAEEMDPNQRLVLEVVYEALLDANINPRSLGGSRTGVYVGAGIAEYMGMAFGDPDNITQHTMSGNSLAVIANRVSYAWDLRGPSLTTDTACSSSLTAFHLACQALEDGSCDLAIVAGVNTLLGPSPFIGFTQAKMLSPQGVSRPFDAEANGFVRGEGCGVVILCRSGKGPSFTRPYARVLAHGVNEDGATPSLTQPSEEAQTALMGGLMQRAGCDPQDVVYVEAHGTGTPVGDPIEARSIAAAMQASKRQIPLPIGSAKGHVGHLETAAGIVGVIKAALVLRYQMVTPTAGHTRTGAAIDLNKLNICIPSSAQPIRKSRPDSKALAAVNSYGFGGANACAVLQEVSEQEWVEHQRVLLQASSSSSALTIRSIAATTTNTWSRTNPADLPLLLVLSSHFKQGLERLEDQWQQMAQQSERAKSITPQQLRAFTAVYSSSRPAGRYRKVLTAPAGSNSWDKVEVLAEGEHVGAAPALMVAFGGQGSQHPEMGMALYAACAVFRDTIALLDTEFARLAGFSLRDQHGFCLRPMTEEAFEDVMVAMPCIVFVEAALWQLLTALGVKPSAVTGHSVGEITAGLAAGCYGLTHLVRIVYARAKAQQRMPRGAMAAWAQGESATKTAVSVATPRGGGSSNKPPVVVAAVNTPRDVTLAGDVEAVERMVEWGKSQQPPVRCTILKVTRAFHSPHCDDSVRQAFLEAMGDDSTTTTVTPPQASSPVWVSSTTGAVMSAAPDSDFWFDNMRNPVRFSDACALVKAGSVPGVSAPKIVIDVAPHPVLTSYIAEVMGASVSIVPLQTRRSGTGLSTLFHALGVLYTRGIDINFSAILLDPADIAGVAVSGLPRPPWEHKQPIRSKTWKTPYHTGPAASKTKSESQPSVAPGPAVVVSSNHGDLWLDPQLHSYLMDHRVDGEIIFPGAGYVAAALRRGIVVRNSSFLRYLPLWKTASVSKQSGSADIKAKPIQLAVSTDGPRVVFHAPSDVDQEYMVCTVPAAGFSAKSTPPLVIDGNLEVVKQRARLRVDLALAYRNAAKHSGLDFGPCFLGMKALWVSEGSTEAVATLKPAPRDQSEEVDHGFPVHPCVLDAVFQTVSFLNGLDSDNFVPAELGLIQLFLKQGQNRVPDHADLTAHTVLTAVDPSWVKGHVDVYSSTAGTAPQLVMSVRDLLLVRAPSRKSQRPQVYQIAMQPTSVDHAVPDAATSSNSASSIVVRIHASPADELWIQGLIQAAQRDHPRLKLVLAKDFAGYCPDWDIDARADVVAASQLLKETVGTPSNRRPLKLAFLFATTLPSGPGSSPVAPSDSVMVEPSPMMGFTRAARNESMLNIFALAIPAAEFPCRSSAVRSALLRLLASDSIGGATGDHEFILQPAGLNGECDWLVPRLQPLSALAPASTSLTPAVATASSAKPEYRLQIGRPGQLSSLGWYPLRSDLEGLRADEVLVEVAAVSLHFKDVMLAMGLLGKDFKSILGMECAGTVRSVGASVTKFKPGDHVMCLAMSSPHIGENRMSLFGTVARAKERQTVIAPGNVPLSQAAGFLGVAATAWHALIDVARLQKGETVLIHSALGGVGLSAVQIAQHVGARVVASAGSAEKRQRLQDMPGVIGTFDSHKPSQFHSSVMEITQGRGVDVVLNSLSGDAQSESLLCMAPGGRFVEIGKRDILSNRRIGLGALKENISFHSVHLDLLDSTHPDRVRALIDKCSAMLAQGTLTTVDTRVFPADRVIEAFQLMAGGKHSGKIVVELPPEFRPSVVGSDGALKVPQTLFPEDRTVLVSGGTRGIGLALARWAADRGARHVLLVGGTNRDQLPADSLLMINRMKALYPTITVEVQTLDVRDAAAVKQLFRQHNPPIAAFIHAANRYGAGDSTNLTGLTDTWQIKVEGAVNLLKAAVSCQDRQSLQLALLLGSLAGLHGNKGQVEYVAANAALSEVAGFWRQRHALPVVALDLPIIVGAGRLKDVRNAAELELNTGRGFGVVSLVRIQEALERVVAYPMSSPNHVVMDCPVWASYLQLNRNPALFDHLCSPADRIAPKAAQSVAPQPQRRVPELKQDTTSVGAVAPSPSRFVHPAHTRVVDNDRFGSSASSSGGSASAAVICKEELQRAVVAKIAFVLGANVSDVDLHVPLPEMGADSLAAVELMNWAQNTYGVTVTQTEFLSGLTAQAFVDRLASEVASGASVQTYTSTSQSEVETNGIDMQLSSDDVAELPARQGAQSQRSNHRAHYERASVSDDVNAAYPQDDDVVDERLHASVQPQLEQSAPVGNVQSVSREDLQQAVVAKIAFVLGANPSDVDLHVPLPEMGADSLAAVELMNWAQNTYGVTVTQTEFLSGLTAQAFVDRLASEVSTAALNTTTVQDPAPKLVTSSNQPSQPAVQPRYHPSLSSESSDDGDMLHRQPQTQGNGHRKHGPKGMMNGNGHSVHPVERGADGQYGERTLYLPESLKPEGLLSLIRQVTQPNTEGVLVFRGQSAHFCTGMDLSAATFGTDAMSEGLERFAELYQALDQCSVPIVCVCYGATRGGGMLFPSVATVVLADYDATFGFPEIRQGGLPGVVSVAAQRRLSKAQCQRLMCLGDAVHAEEAQRVGLVDFVGSRDEVERELKRVLGRFRQTSTELLSTCKVKCPAATVDQALLVMGSLDKRDRAREREPDALVRLELDAASGVCILELNDPTHCNAIDWAIADDLRRAIEKLKRMDGVRAIVLQGAGDHFCVGVNPYNFIRRTKALPTITSGQITYEIYRAFVGVRDAGVPVIAAVHGKVVGGGLAAMLNADYRIAQEGTEFNYGNLPRGVCPGLLLSHNLQMVVGHRTATELYMNDLNVSASDALKLGLVNELRPTVEQCKRAAWDFAARLASYPPTGVRATLSLMRPAIDEARLAKECMGIARCNKVGKAFEGKWKVFGRSKAEIEAVNHDSAEDKDRIAPTHVEQNAEHQAVAEIKPGALLDGPAVRNAWSDHEEMLGRWTQQLPEVTPDVFEHARVGPIKGSVFLTGASGFLGAYILRELLDRGLQVITLVRADDAATAKQRVVRNLMDYGLWRETYDGSVTAVCGDIESARFGLSDDAYELAVRSCDLLVHNAAVPDFSATMNALENPNIGGTLRAIEFAVAGRMRLAHVSSLSVFSMHWFVGEASQLRPDPTILINAYARSKWLAEQLVWTAAQKGLPAVVIRPGRIMGDSQTGAANLKDWFSRFVSTSLSTGTCWDIDQYTDMTQVDDVARLVVGSALDCTAPLTPPGRCLHAVSLEALSNQQIVGELRSMGYSLKLIPFRQWMSLIGRSGKALQPLVDFFSSLPIEQTSGQKLRFSSDMPHSGGTGLESLRRMLRWMQNTGFIPPPERQQQLLAQMTSVLALRTTSAVPALKVATVKTVDVQVAPDARNGIHAPIQAVSKLRPARVGIHALELYTPNHYVEQRDMEQHHGCPGKYTTGLLQEQIGFCGDDEDAVSMALTVVDRLVRKSGLRWQDIGRLEVGTESLLDRSKSIKTHLMRLFEAHGCNDLGAAVDNYNACYGGTAALHNTLNWVESSAYDGRWGIVVAVDIADLNDEQSFLNGASAVAMLIGPDAPLEVLPERANHFMNTHDFYKPVAWKDPYPLMRDGKHSIDCYMACLEGCFNRISNAIGTSQSTSTAPSSEEKPYNLVTQNDYFVYHCTSTYLCKRAFKKTCELAYPADKGQALKLKEQQDLYLQKCEPGCMITKRIGSSYTASVYTNLCSLLATQGQHAIGRTAVLFSYGSGSAASMFRVRVHALPRTFDGVALFKMLDARMKHEPKEFVEMVEAYSKSTYGRTNFKPASWGGRQAGVWYLQCVDEWGVRDYQPA